MQVLQVCTRNHSRKITRQATELSRGSRKHIPSFGSLLHYSKSNRHANGRKLDPNMFESYLEDLWSKISQEKRSSYTYIDCLWFCIYKFGLAKTKVLQWIKSKQIFSRKYVFVPIICWIHWSLFILCHFGESGQSKQKKPIMLLLDSFHKIDPKRLEPDIRRFVLDIFRSEERKVNEESISEIPLLIPKVPQQRSSEECGMFVLYFIYYFLQCSTSNFTLDGYPYFDWFASIDLESFQKEIHSFWMSKNTI